MDNSTTHEAALLLQQEWDLQLPETISEEAILQALKQRVIAQLENGPEAFFQLMYRLDIPERKLDIAMQDAEAAEKIARLIYERQLQKIQSRLHYRNTKPDEDAELKW